MPQRRLARVRLGEVGLEYIKRRLGISERRFTRPLVRALAHLPLEQGEVWTWATRGSALSLKDLDYGLPAGITQKHHRDLLVSAVERYLVRRGRLALVEDHYATPQDPWLRQEPVLPQWLGFGKQVYWYATEPDRVVVRKVLNWGVGLLSCVALTRPSVTWPPTKRLTSAQIEKLASTTDHFIVDAFDFEGCVVWSR